MDRLDSREYFKLELFMMCVYFVVILFAPLLGMDPCVLVHKIERMALQPMIDLIRSFTPVAILNCVLAIKYAYDRRFKFDEIVIV